MNSTSFCGLQGLDLFKYWNKLLPCFVQLSHSTVYKVVFIKSAIKIVVSEVVLAHGMVAGCQNYFLHYFVYNPELK